MDTTLPARRCLLAITGAFALEGGIAVANRSVVHALIDAGYQIDLLGLNEPVTSAATYARFAGVHARGFDNSKARFTLAVWRALLAHRYAFVFCDHVNLAMILLPFSQLKWVRCIVRLNGVEVFAPLPNREGRLGLSAATVPMAISDHTKERVLAQFPHLPVVTCDLSIDPAASEQALTSPGAVSETITLEAVDGSFQRLGSRVLLHVGRMSALQRHKGHDTMIRALPLIRAQFPDVQLVLAGKGSDRERLLALAHTLPEDTQRAIFMPGFVADADLQKLYRQCFLFAMPSRGEGFGLVYLEAMRWGKPCLGSNLDAAQCIIRDAETGILVDDPDDPQEAAARIIDLLKDPARAGRLGQAGYQRLCDRFLYPQFRQRFLALIPDEHHAQP